MRPLRALLLVAGAVTACGTEADLTDCQTVFSEAAAVDPVSEQLSDLDEAFTACATVAEFELASERFPDALDGTDAVTFAVNRCNNGLTGSICEQLEL